MAEWYDGEDRLGEILEHSEKYTGSDFWQRYVEGRFCKMNVHQRGVELTAWDRKLDEYIEPNRETAALISKRRQLGNLHDLLRKAGK